jgi:Carboxypeptidase regulatory-like domain
VLRSRDNHTRARGAAALALAALLLALNGCGGRTEPGPNTAAGAVTGVVTAQSGPISGAAVSLVSADGSQWTATSGSDGYFELDKIPAGAAQLSVAHDGYGPWSGQVLVLPNSTATQNVHLNAI